MAGIGIIANPHSKLNKRNPERQKLLSYIAGERGQIEITNNLSELKKAAQGFFEKNIEILAINGGDGTISQTLTAMITAYQGHPLPKIALLRGGTINMLADNLGIKGSPQELLSKLLENHAANSLSYQSIPSINIHQTYGFIFGSGTCARFLMEFYKNKTGRLGSLLLILRLALSIFGNRDFHKNIVKNDTISLSYDATPPNTHESLSVFASTVKKMPMGIPFFTKLSQHLPQMQVASIIFTEREIAYKLPLLLINRNKPKAYEMSHCCQQLRIQAKDPFPYTLDGEIYEAKNGSVNINMGPQITFITL